MRTITLLLCISLFACNSKKETAPAPVPAAASSAYKPDDPVLYTAIATQDSIFFTAYNNCDLETQARYYADSIEFYHDKGGRMTDKQKLLDDTKKYVCGHTTRTLVPGSLEVYPIKDFGAIEMGQHIFRNSLEPDAPVHAAKFVIFWQQVNNEWVMTKVVSLH